MDNSLANCAHSKLESDTDYIPMLLCNTGYYGTLAAIRSLGRAGVSVITADPSAFAFGRFSRYSRMHLRCPPFEATNLWAEWLADVAHSGPKRAICATSDAVSYALARHRLELGSLYYIYQPTLGAIMSILDKGRLIEHARAVGIDTPETWLPKSRAEALQIACDVEGPIVVKPRSQLAVRNYTKGKTIKVIDGQPGGVTAAFNELLRVGAHDADFADRHPEIMVPMLQRHYSEAMAAVYSLSGFLDASGTHFAMRGAKKLLQRPLSLGIGLCFEHADVDPALAEKIVQFCRRIGYFGVFEAEFIVCGGRSLLIDFNGRLYNQLAFDVARGLDLPALAYASAIGDNREVLRLIASMFSSPAETDWVFCNRTGLVSLISAQRLFGIISRDKARYWRRRFRTTYKNVIDTVDDLDDPLPGYADAVQQVYGMVRHPRAFFTQAGLGK